jgi:hypothetical protein
MWFRQAKEGIRVMDEDDKQTLHAAAILLAAAVGQTHEPANQKQVMIAAENARKLSADPVQQLRVTANHAIPGSLIRRWHPYRILPRAGLRHREAVHHADSI